MANSVKEFTFRPLDQFDNESGDFEGLNKIPKNYLKQLGSFVIIFSFLEHNINLVVADMLNDRSHSVGYMVIASLSMHEKIDFLNSLFLNFLTVTDQLAKKPLLKKINKELVTMNAFRNALVHANWGTLKKDGNLRTKIITDKNDGSVKFKNIVVTPEIILKAIGQCDDLIENVDRFFMNMHNDII